MREQEIIDVSYNFAIKVTWEKKEKKRNLFLLFAGSGGEMLGDVSVVSQ